jgi:hypothetical protein
MRTSAAQLANANTDEPPVPRNQAQRLPADVLVVAAEIGMFDLKTWPPLRLEFQLRVHCQTNSGTMRAMRSPLDVVRVFK